MADRESLYSQFGPMLLEAIVLIVLDEINVLRTAAGLPARTQSQLVTALEAKLSTLSEYDWMKDQILEADDGRLS